MRYAVRVADNFHYMDDDYVYTLGTFESLSEAEEACRRVVERSIMYEPGATAKKLFEHYTSFGEDSFIVAIADEGEPRPEHITFSAWDYARQLCDKLAADTPTQI